MTLSAVLPAMRFDIILLCPVAFVGLYTYKDMPPVPPVPPVVSSTDTNLFDCAVELIPNLPFVLSPQE